MTNTEKRNRFEHFTGAASEHLVASMYLSKGFQVYWPAMQQGAVDLVTHRDDVFTRVQVKTATWHKSGKFKYLQCRIRLTKKYKDISPAELYDLLVVVAPDGRLWEIPADTINSSNICLDGTGPRGIKRNEWIKFLVQD